MSEEGNEKNRIEQLLEEYILPILVPAIERVPSDVAKQSLLRDFLYAFLQPILALSPIDIRLKSVFVGRESILSEYTDEEIAEEILPLLTIGEIHPRMHIFIEIVAEMQEKEFSCLVLLYVNGDMKVTVEDLWVNELPRWSHSSMDWATLLPLAEKMFWIVFTVAITKLFERVIEKAFEKKKES